MSNSRAWLNRQNISKTKIGLQLVLTATLLMWLYWQMDPGLIWAELSQLTGKAVCATLALFIISILVATPRLKMLIKTASDTKNPTSGLLIRFNLIGFFFNTCLPGGVGGDVVKGWLLYKTGITGEQAIAAVTLDRVFGFFILTVFITAGAPIFINISTNKYLNVLIAVMAMLPFLTVLSYILGRWSLNHLKKIRRGKYGSFVRQILNITDRIICNYKILIVILLTSLVNQMILIYIFYLIGSDLGVPLTLKQYFCAVPAALLISMIPISLGGWGLREASFAGIIAVWGTSLEQAVLISLLYGFLQIIAALLGLAVWLHYKLTVRGSY